MIFMLFVMLLFFISFFVYYGYLYNLNSLISYECGFNSIFSSRNSFSMHFYIFMLIFLIFDAEIVFILPLLSFFSSLFVNFFVIFVVYFIVFFSLIFEWYDGSLSWSF